MILIKLRGDYERFYMINNVIIRTRKIARNEHIVLSIKDSNGNLMPLLYDTLTNTRIVEGDILLDSELFKILQKLTLYRTDTLMSEDISQWNIQ